MCTVQVLLFAEVMRQGGGGLRPGGVRGVCRKLFASDAANDPSQVLKRMEEQLRKRDTARWNFDFQKETPLPGRYQWMPISQSLRASDITSASRKIEDDVQIVAEVRPAASSSSIPACKTKRSSAGATTQAKITDFMCSKRKRFHIEDESVHKLKRVRRSNSHLTATTTSRPT